MSKASQPVYENWSALSLLTESNISSRLYSTLLEERKSLIQALAELLVNSDRLKQPIKKKDLKVFEKGSIKKKRQILLSNKYRKKIVPKICKAAILYLKDGSRQSD